MIENDAAKLTRNRHYFRFWMPYLFQKIDVDGVAWAFLPLNRNYVPLGIFSKEQVNYADYAISHGIRFPRNPAAIEGVWDHVDAEGERLWLYSDSPSSRKTYFARFEKIMSRSLPILAPKGRND